MVTVCGTANAGLLEKVQARSGNVKADVSHCLKASRYLPLIFIFLTRIKANIYLLLKRTAHI